MNIEDPTQLQAPIINVGLISRSLTIGGAQQHIVKLCQKSSRKRVKLSLFLLIQDEENQLRSQLPDDIQVCITPYPRYHPLTPFWLVQQLKKQHIQLIHSFLWTGDAYASLAHVLGARIPVIISERGDRGFPFYKQTLRYFLDRLLVFRNAKHACANSSFGKKLLISFGYPPDRIDIIPNGVDLAKIDAALPTQLRSELGIPPDAILIGMVSRLIEYKGIDIFIKSANILQYEKIYFCIIGDGPARASFQTLVDEAGIQNKFFFLGARNPVLPYIKAFDIAVSSTRMEHCSNSILEYMACGKPVVATDVGGNPELVINNETGLLVPSEDPESLCEALRTLLRQPSLIQKMGENGRKRIEENFRLDDIVERFEGLWLRKSNLG